MTDLSELDRLLETQPLAEATLAGAVTERKCRRHVWAFVAVHVSRDSYEKTATEECLRCGIVKDEVRSRRGKAARRAGNDAERELAKAYPGGKRVGHLGGKQDVVVAGLFVIQSKRVNPGSEISGKRAARFPEWMWDELQVLPRTGGLIPTLVVSDKPGLGKRRRTLVIRELADDIALHGPETGDAA